MFCKNCGAKLKDGAKFCGNCGCEQSTNINSKGNARGASQNVRIDGGTKKHSKFIVPLIVVILIIVFGSYGVKMLIDNSIIDTDNIMAFFDRNKDAEENDDSNRSAENIATTEKIAESKEKEISISTDEKNENAISETSAMDKYLSDKINSVKCVNEYSPNTQNIMMDTLTFGSYYQINETAPLEWHVLKNDKENRKALLISKYVIECRSYNEDKVAVNWENCTLNAWLNSIFLNNTFTADEKNNIINVLVPSIDDMNNYFNDDEARKAIATAYTIRNGCWVSSNYFIANMGTVCYFLSDNGDAMDKAAFVGDSGRLGTWGSKVNLHDCGVRPAIWVKY